MPNPATPGDTLPTPDRYGVLTTGRALEALWNECQGTAPQELIDWMAAHATDTAVQHLRNLAEVAEGLGCLVASDGDSSLPSGNFQTGRDVGTLLFHIGQSIDTLAHLADIGDAAKFWKLNPEKRGTWGKAT